MYFNKSGRYQNVYNDIKITEIHQTDAFYLKKNNNIENGGHLEKNGRHLGFSSGPSGTFDQ